ncbi:hypothetical protein D3C76_1345870 [compost metagenome]
MNEYKMPVMPDSQTLFQKMIDIFGTAGTIGISIIGGAVLLGILCVLAMWGWRHVKHWLAMLDYKYGNHESFESWGDRWDYE